MRFLQARFYTAGPRSRGPIVWIVLHAMEAAEKPDTAEAVASYFAAGCPRRMPDGTTQLRQASAHYTVDSNSEMACVHEDDIAYHAPGANAQGIGVELAGFSKQNVREWTDAYGMAMLDRAAILVADICKRRGIPIRFVDADGLRAGQPGITTHAEVSKAWKKTDHYDPGSSFPMLAFLAAVQRASAGDVTPMEGDEEMALSDSDIAKVADKVADVVREDLVRIALVLRENKPNAHFSNTNYPWLFENDYSLKRVIEGKEVAA